MGGKKPDPKRIQIAMREGFESAKERFRKSSSLFRDNRQG
jgi:hypothetical protein